MVEFFSVGMFGIIGAMEGEVQLFRNALSAAKEKQIANLRFVSGQLNGKDVVVVRCGLGKVNAALCTQILIDRFDCSQITMCGVAGSLNKSLSTGDIVAASECVQHDMDARGLGFAPGQIPFTDDRVFKADNQLVQAAVAAGKQLGLHVVPGTMATGDLFLEDEAKGQQIVGEFGADAVDMEAGAVAQTCHYNHVPFLVVKAVTDNADEEAAKNFNAFLKRAAENSFRLVSALVKAL